MPAALVRALEACADRQVVVVTGAGISLASGIPTFRGTDPDAVWKNDVTELGTNRYFQSDPVGSWRWYTSRFDMVLDKAPNAAHFALAALERWQLKRGGGFQLITQNVDTLHEDAGSDALIKVHGSADRVRCSRVGCECGPPWGSVKRADIDMAPFFADPCLETLPRCPACDELLRQHVLWFDEFYDGHQDYQWSSVIKASQSMAVLLFVGTSFAVGVTELFLQAAQARQVPMFAVDPGAREAPRSGMVLLREKSEVLLPEVARRLGTTVRDR